MEGNCSPPTHNWVKYKKDRTYIPIFVFKQLLRYLVNSIDQKKFVGTQEALLSHQNKAN